LRCLVKSPTIPANVWIAFFVLFGNSIASIPERQKRHLVDGVRQTFGLIGAPIRRSMRSGSENPYAPKKRMG
jgi:GTP-binding protein